MKIKIQEIKDRGNDEERIVLKVLEDCNLCRYLVLDTTFDKDGNISNKNRHVYAFGDVPVRKGDNVVLYTKVGNDVRQTNAMVQLATSFIGICLIIFGIMNEI